MPPQVTLESLRDALGTASSEDGGATARIERALDAIGWRGTDSLDAAEVAQAILPAIVSCVREHHALGIMYGQIAEVLRHSGPVLDGSLPPVHDYVPAAADVVRRFIAAER